MAKILFISLYFLMISISPRRPTFRICEALPVLWVSTDGGTTKFTASLISCGMSEKRRGVGSPETLAEVPDLKAMHAASDAGEVVYVSISFDRSKEAWEKYVKENGMGWVQLFDASGKKDSKIGEAYHVKWIPSMYLIGADGKVELGTVVLEKIAKKLNIKLSK